LPGILCGMVSSSVGWKQTDYVPCPATAELIAGSCVQVEGRQLRIVPGLACRNRFGAPDLMRGEETQVLGALSLKPELAHGLHLICAPGTHTKWVIVEDGAICEVLTAPTGEVYALIREHGILLDRHWVTASSESDAAFKRGLASLHTHPDASVLHRIFECRSLSLRKDLAPEEAGSYLSGLLIGDDVRGALRVFSEHATRVVHVIGSQQVRDLYASALTSVACEAQGVDGAIAARAGLTQLHQLLLAHSELSDSLR
jgi:2-dehydro-3-deoxygalactonokinase